MVERGSKSLRRRRREVEDAAIAAPSRITPLHFAAGALDAELVSDLIRRGANPNAEDFDHIPPIHNVLGDRANENRVLPTLKALLEGGASPDETEGHGVTPLMIVSRRGWTAAAELLVNHNGKLFYEFCGNYETGLHWAIHENQIETAAFLAGKMEGRSTKIKRWDPDIPLLEIPSRRDGNTPYLAACNALWTSAEMLIMLEKHGVNTQATRGNKQNAWHLAANACSHHAFDTGPGMGCSSLKFQHLFELDLPGMDSEDDLGKTPLHYAARMGCVANISFLLLNGAEIDHPDKHGMTPLAETVEKIYPAAAKLLLKAGANPHTPYYIEGSTRHGNHTPREAALNRQMTMGEPWNTWIKAVRQAFEH